MTVDQEMNDSTTMLNVSQPLFLQKQICSTVNNTCDSYLLFAEI